jgi:hypothetical protein
MNEGLLAGIQRCPTERKGNALRFDQGSGGYPRTSYVGTAKPGSIEGAAVWAIKKLVETSGGDITLTWADGNSNEDNIWSNRASLSYS